MRSKKKNPTRVPAPVYRAIKVPPPQPIASPVDRDTTQCQPGEAGKAAITAAALQQLNRYAQDIQDFLEASRMDSLLDQIQSDLSRPRIPHPVLRLHRD